MRYRSMRSRGVLFAVTLVLVLVLGAGCAELFAPPVSGSPTGGSDGRTAPSPAGAAPAGGAGVVSGPTPHPIPPVEGVPVPVVPLPVEAFVAPDEAESTPAVAGVDPYVVPPPALEFTPSRYWISARLDAVTKLIGGSQSVEVANNSADTWTEVWFHLFPNAFTVEAGAPTFVAPEREYPRGFNPAWLRVEAPGTEVVADAHGKETLLRYPLASPLGPGERTTLTLRFEAKIPEAQSRFSHFDDVYALGNWYPIVAAYDAGGWRRDPYYRIGDPFYSPVAEYAVELQVPKGFVVGATGVERAVDTAAPDVDTYQITTGLVRDFAVAASPRYREIRREAGPVTVRVLYLDDAGARGGTQAADAARDSVLFFGQTFGAYPYRVLTAAQTYFPGGMEYPTLVFLGDVVFQPAALDRRALDFLTAHEVAHQWWYGLVGNDQILQPWLDEGLAQYSMYRFMRTKGVDARPSVNSQYDDTGLFYRSVPSYGADDAAYNYQVYEHGAAALFRLQEAVGIETMDRILKTYFERYQYRIATVDDFVQVVAEVAGQPGLEAIAPYMRPRP